MALVRMFPQRIHCPRDVDVSEQIEMILAIPDGIQNERITVPVLELTPNLDHIQIRVADQYAVSLFMTRVLQCELSLRNSRQIFRTIGPVQCIKVLSCIFLDPDGLERLRKVFGEF